MVGALLAPLLALLLLRWFEQRTVYQPISALDATGDEIGFPRKDVQLTTKDEIKLHAWYFPVNDPAAEKVFLVCHGNGGNISHRLELYEVLLREGPAVFAFDYRGYGQSEGTPSEEGTYLDAEAAYDWLMKQGYLSANVIAFGESLGGGVASELALRKPIGGLVLQSTYTSTADLGAELFPWLPVRTLGRINYNTRRKLPRIHVPVLVLHSPDDTIIPVHHGHQNFEAANDPKLFHEMRGDHNDAFFTDRDAIVLGIRQFLRLTNNQGKEVAGKSVAPPNSANADEEER